MTCHCPSHPVWVVCLLVQWAKGEEGAGVAIKNWEFYLRKDPGREQFLAVKSCLKDRSKVLHSRNVFWRNQGRKQKQVAITEWCTKHVAAPSPSSSLLPPWGQGGSPTEQACLPLRQGFLASAGSRVLRATSFKASGISPGHHSLKWSHQCWQRLSAKVWG